MFMVFKLTTITRRNSSSGQRALPMVLDAAVLASGDGLAFHQPLRKGHPVLLF